MQIYAIELESMQTERLPHVRPAFLSKRFNQWRVWAGLLEFCWQQHPVSRNTMTKNNQICIIKHIMKTTPEENGSLFCSTCHFFVASHDSLGHSHRWRLWWGHGGRLPGGNGEGENKKTYIMKPYHISHLEYLSLHSPYVAFHPHPGFSGKKAFQPLIFHGFFLSLQTSNKWWLE